MRPILLSSLSASKHSISKVSSRLRMTKRCSIFTGACASIASSLSRGIGRFHGGHKQAEHNANRDHKRAPGHGYSFWLLEEAPVYHVGTRKFQNIPGPF